MKKLLTLSLSAILAFSTVLCGCSESSSSTENTSSNIEATSVIATEAETLNTVVTEEATIPASDDKVQINDSTLGEIWISPLEGVPVNQLDNNKLTTESGYKYYGEDCLVGIDVSSYNGDIDWAKVKNSGVDFAMIRIGGRGYGESGVLYSDDRAIQHLNEAKAQSIKVGVYFFSQAVNETEAIEEADYVKALLGDIELDFPIGFDWEIIENDTARTDNVTAEELTDCARAFCDRVRELGYTPIIYSESNELYFKYDLQKLSDVDIWYCEYADTPSFYYEFSMWQYSCTGQVDGIDGDVDLNLCFTDVADYD